MAYFPLNIIPKNLAPESNREVDNSPNIYNSRDYNTHLRELIAVEKFLVGDGLSATDDPGSQGIISLLNALLEVFNNISQNGIISKYSGLIVDGAVPIPTDIPNTKTRAATGTANVTIAVDSVSGFPTAGYITKFNSIKTVISSDFAIYGFGNNVSSQEVIQYTGVDTVNNEFTGCTRDPLTAQAVPSGIVGDTAQAVIIAGRASVCLAHKGWTAMLGYVPEQVFIDHNASLEVTSAVYDQIGTQIDSAREVIYSLIVSGSFADVQVSESV